MTNHSNAITDILVAHSRGTIDPDPKRWVMHPEEDTILALQALYEAVVASLPPIYYVDQEDYKDEVLTNLQELFGVDDQGNDLVASDRNAKNSTANPPKQGSAGISKEGDIDE